MGGAASSNVPRSISCRLPYLRRHARMLLGTQAEADDLVAQALDGFEQDLDDGPDVAAFKALYRALRARPPRAAPIMLANDRQAQADARLRSLSPSHRSVLLLSAVEGLGLGAVAKVLERPLAEVEALADEAQLLLERGLETTVLIIEDEWAIARDLRRIVSGLGHEITAVVATRADAVAAAKRSRPGLVLADVNLADGSSGVDAVRDIFEDGAAPTIFITAYPERLLTGERPEPTYLISKPYSPGMIQATVSQALFFSDAVAGRG